jgi:hypothetical protein
VARTQRVKTDVGVTWTVLGDDERVVGPVEGFLSSRGRVSIRRTR